MNYTILSPLIEMQLNQQKPAPSQFKTNMTPFEIQMPTSVPQVPLKKQVILVLLCVSAMLPVLYIYNIPQSLQTQMQQAPYNLDPQEFNVIYMCSLFPNFIFFVLSAYVTTRLGAIKSLLLSVSLLTFGQLLVLYSVYSVSSNWYGYILFARIIQSYAGLNIQISESVLLPKFCSKDYLPIFIACLSIGPWSFQGIDNVVSPLVYSLTGSVPTCFAIGFILTLVGFCSAIALIYYVMSLSKDYGISYKTEQQSMPKIQYALIHKLGKIIFILFGIHLVESSFQEPILINANDMLHQRVGFTNVEAGRIFSVTYVSLFSGVFLWTFVYKKIVDRKKLFLVQGLLFFTVLLLLVNLPKTVTSESTAQAVLAFMLLGLKDSLGLTMVDGSIPLIVEQQLLPMAFSFVIAGQFIGSGINVFLTGAIIKAAPTQVQGYVNCYYLFFAYFIIYFCLLLYMAFTKNSQALRINKVVQPIETNKQSIDKELD